MRYLLCIILWWVAGSSLGQSSSSIPVGGLVADYPLDNNAIDRSQNSNHGELKGGITATADRFGNMCGALHFNGVDGYINVPASVSLKSPVSALSITAWFKMDKGKSPGEASLVLLSKSGTLDKANSKAQYRFVLTRGFGESSATISLSSDVSAIDNNYSSHPIAAEEWHFLAVVYEENWVNVFINNKLIAQSLVKRPFTQNDLNLEIGRDASGTAKYFSGSLDDIRIYNRGLSPFEMNSLFNDQTSKNSMAGLALTMPKNIESIAQLGKCSAVVTFTEPTISAACALAELKQIRGLPSGSLFPVGKSTIVYEAKAGDKKITDSFSVMVIDREPPILNCPLDQEVKASGLEKKTLVEYSAPIATDNCPNVRVELVEGPGSSIFPDGTTTMRFRAVDASGSSSTCSFKVNVTRTITKVVHCPNDQIAYTKPDGENALVKYEEPYIDIMGNRVAMKRVKGGSSGSLFRLGKNEIKYESFDTTDRSKSCTFYVNVYDTIKPQIICPADIFTTANSGTQSAQVNYSLPKATDGGSPISVRLTEGYLSGSNFPIGVSKVAFEAIDETGNKSECSFRVVVQEKKEEKQKPISKQVVNPPDATEPSTVVAKKEEKKITEPQKELTTEQKIKEVEKLFMPELEQVKKQPAPIASEVKEISEQKLGESQKPFTTPVPAPKEKSQPETKTVTNEKVDAKDKRTEAKKLFFDEAPVKPKEEVKEVAAPAPPEELGKKVEQKPVEATVKMPVIKESKDTAPKPSAPAKPLRLDCTASLVQKTDAGKCGAVVNYNPPAIEGGRESKLIQTKGIESGNFFKVGRTANTFLATDASGTRKECAFNVTIKDEEPPVFKCPDDTTIHLPANRRGIIYYYKDPIVTDNCGIDSLIMVAGSKEGCFLQIGVHPFIYKAIDAQGNYQICTHSVIIKEDIAPVQNIPPPQKLDEHLKLGKDSVHYEYKAEVNDCLLTVFMYDDGEEDNDTVSIIFNDQIIVNREMIRIKENRMIKRVIVLDSGNENFIIAKAWNKGKFGLNTLRIDVYEGNIENEKRDLKEKKPVMSKVLHSRPGTAGGMILKCSQ